MSHLPAIMISVNNPVPRLPKKGKSLAEQRPLLVPEWDTATNGGVSPEQVGVSSAFRAAWVCSVCAHRWEAPVYSRARGHGCIKCRNRAISVRQSIPPVGESLAEKHPAIAAQWVTERNGGVTPEQVAAQSRRRSWWRCGVCSHQWVTHIYNRTAHKGGCPACWATGHSTRMAQVTHYADSLAHRAPLVAAEWDDESELNGGAAPHTVKGSSGRRVGWKCATCDHRWVTQIANRTKPDGSRCPACWAHERTDLNYRPVKDPADSLAACSPHVAAEWDDESELNAGITPNMVRNGSGLRVGWKCGTCDHKWVTTVAHRTLKQSGCPRCVRRKESSQEVGMRQFLLPHMRLDEERYVPRNDGVSSRPWNVDLLSIDRQLIVEFDGSYWHSEKCNPGVTVKDAHKATDLRGQGYRVVRIRETPLKKLHSDDLVVPRRSTGKQIGEQLLHHLTCLNIVDGIRADTDVA